MTTPKETVSSPEGELKVVITVKDGLGAIGVQAKDTDPILEVFEGRSLVQLAEEVPAMLARAQGKWQESPRNKAYERPPEPEKPGQTGKPRATAQAPRPVPAPQRPQPADKQLNLRL